MQSCIASPLLYYCREWRMGAERIVAGTCCRMRYKFWYPWNINTSNCDTQHISARWFVPPFLNFEDIDLHCCWSHLVTSCIYVSLMSFLQPEASYPSMRCWYRSNNRILTHGDFPEMHVPASTDYKPPDSNAPLIFSAVRSSNYVYRKSIITVTLIMVLDLDLLWQSLSW